MRRFERFATTADVGLRVRGRDLAEFYGNAVAGLSATLFGSLRDRRDDQFTPFRYSGDGPENVLVNLLAAVLALSHRRRAVTSLAVSACGPRRLRGVLRHRPWPRPPALEVKAVTYHDLHVTRAAGRFAAAVVFDV